MRLMSLAIAVAALSLVGASAPAAISRAPRMLTTAAAIPQRWQQPCRIYYASGSWEYGAVVWVGMADSIDWSTVTYMVFGGPGLQPASSWLMVGARVEVFGTPSLYR